MQGHKTHTTREYSELNETKIKPTQTKQNISFLKSRDDAERGKKSTEKSTSLPISAFFFSLFLIFLFLSPYSRSLLLALLSSSPPIYLFLVLICSSCWPRMHLPVLQSLGTRMIDSYATPSLDHFFSWEIILILKYGTEMSFFLQTLDRKSSPSQPIRKWAVTMVNLKS